MLVLLSECSASHVTSLDDHGIPSFYLAQGLDQEGIRFKEKAHRALLWQGKRCVLVK